MHFSRKNKKTCSSYISCIFWKRAINFNSQQIFYSLKLTDLNANHFHSSCYLTIKEKPELRLNGMVTPNIMDFRIFHFLLLWYDRVWQFISKKYNFLLWTSFFSQIFDFKPWKMKTTSHEMYWDNHIFQRSPSLLLSMLMGLQITPRPCCGQITDPQYWYRGGEGGLNGAI